MPVQRGPRDHFYSNRYSSAAMSEETSDRFERVVAGVSLSKDVVPDSNGGSCVLWRAQVRLLTQKRGACEPNFP